MRRLWFFVIAIVTLCSSLRAAEPVKRIYVFGDSYSDVGRGFIYSNGPTAVAFLAKRLGLEMLPGNAPNAGGKSLNFAVSGAKTGESSTGGSWEVIGMKAQVAEFSEKVRMGSAAFDPKTTLFFLAGGLNDGREQTEATVMNLESEIQSLYALGARRFVVAILPEKIPAFHAVGARLNPALERIPNDLQPKLKDAEIELSHWGAFFDEVMDHPSQYGIKNTTDPCVARSMFTQETAVCATPDAYFYFYAIHPSRAVAKVVGDMMYAEMTGAKPFSAAP